MVAPGEGAGARLKRYRLRAELKLVDLARQTGYHHAYLSQIEHEKLPPPRHLLVALAPHLALSAAEVDELLAAAGHLPARWQTLGPRDPTLEAVLDVLCDDSLDPGVRLRFRGWVEAAADRVLGRGRP